MPHNVVVLLDNPEGVEMTKRICKERGLDFHAFCELVQAEVDQTGNPTPAEGVCARYRP